MIDANYQGEVKVILHNHGNEDFHVKQSNWIAQLIVYFNQPLHLRVVMGGESIPNPILEKSFDVSESIHPRDDEDVLWNFPILPDVQEGMRRGEKGFGSTSDINSSIKVDKLRKEYIFRSFLEDPVNEFAKWMENPNYVTPALVGFVFRHIYYKRNHFSKTTDNGYVPYFEEDRKWNSSDDVAIGLATMQHFNEGNRHCKKTSKIIQWVKSLEPEYQSYNTKAILSDIFFMITSSALKYYFEPQPFECAHDYDLTEALLTFLNLNLNDRDNFKSAKKLRDEFYKTLFLDTAQILKDKKRTYDLLVENEQEEKKRSKSDSSIFSEDGDLAMKNLKITEDEKMHQSK